jgi:predicted SprT family Zn-dependent metalloprotease
MNPLLLELLNWIAPKTAPSCQRAPRPLPPFSPVPPSLPSLPVSTASEPPSKAELPSEASLEALSRELFREVGCPELALKVIVRWNSRLQSTAGRAHYWESKVVLNPKLVQFGPGEIDRTLRHELAHLLARHRAGRTKISPHGPEWKQACRDLGLADEKRTHTLGLPRRQIQRKHAYSCPHCATVVARVRPFRAKVACLACCRKYAKGRYAEKFRLVKQPSRG